MFQNKPSEFFMTDAENSRRTSTFGVVGFAPEASPLKVGLYSNSFSSDNKLDEFLIHVFGLKIG